MGFSKYCHIENTYQESLLKKALWEGLGKTECVCAVKVDGANFQAGIDKDGRFFIGSRNNELPADENFSGCQEVLKRYDVERKLRKLLRELGCESILFYGELCGGLYRHPEVPIDKGAVRIQGRVDYSPRNEWIVFDAKVDDKFFSKDRLAELCEKEDFHCKEIIFRGTLQEF